MLPHFLLSWLQITFFLSTTTLITSGFGFPGQNTPPVFDFKREWLVPDNEPVGSRITTVRTKDEDKDSIVYGIEPSQFLDGSNYFTINPKTGDVFLKETLSGQSGNDYYLFITANDGHQTAKIEVYTRVLDSNENKNSRVSGSIAAFDVPFNTSYPGLPARPRPFPSFNVPLPPPKNPFIAVAPSYYPTSGSSSTKKTNVLPEFAHTSTTDPLASRHSNSTLKKSSTTPVPKQPTESPPAATSQSSEDTRRGEDGGGSNGDSVKFHSTGRPGIGIPTGRPADRSSHQIEIINIILFVFGFLGLAIVLGYVFFIFHRKLSARPNLIKSLSQKTPADKSQSRETSISSSTGVIEYNGALFEQIRSKRAYSNRYESPDFASTQFNNESGEGIKWEFPRHHLRFIGILGEGCFGQVWKCEALNICNSEGPQIVAVKTLKENASNKEKKDLLSELEIMKILDPHPNVVTLFGCCTNRDPIFLIMEYVPYGKLQAYLRDSRAERFYGNHLGSLTSKDLTSFAYQVAKGMEYIASKGIIHRDLAARNVLIGNNKTCKIADFGFARDVIANHVYERKSEGRLPIRWMAPESLYDNIFTTKSDVWSFGILMWEIVTLGSTPYPGLAAAEVMKKVRDGHRLEKPDHCKREMYNIMFYCWDNEPKERPSFSELVVMLDKLLISENDYIELDRFPDHSYYNIITSLSGEKL